MHYEVETEIAAPPDVVWAVLTDGPAWPSWDSGVVRVEGDIRPGNRIKVVPEINPKRAFPVKVTEFRPPQAMTWTGGMPLGLFKGVRRYELTPTAGGGTAFAMREDFSGPLLPLIGRSMPDFGPSFQQFANGLKARAEA